jgi:hypothetical protein
MTQQLDTRARSPIAVARPALLAGLGALVVIATVAFAALRGPAGGDAFAVTGARLVPEAPTIPEAPVVPDVPRDVVPPAPAPQPAPGTPTPAPAPAPSELIDRETVERALVSIERFLTDERVTSRVDDVRSLGAQLIDADEVRVLVDLARERFTTATAELPGAVDRFEEWLAERTAPAH